MPGEEVMDEDVSSVFCCLCRSWFFGSVFGGTWGSCVPPGRSLGETTNSVNCSNRPNETEGEKETIKTRGEMVHREHEHYRITTKH